MHERHGLLLQAARRAGPWDKATGANAGRILHVDDDQRRPRRVDADVGALPRRPA
jgi:hypothetical protein